MIYFSSTQQVDKRLLLYKLPACTASLGQSRQATGKKKDSMGSTKAKSGMSHKQGSGDQEGGRLLGQ